jgi:hypothetical protein
MVRSKVACLLLDAHNAARTAATAGRDLGMPPETTSPGSHRLV